MAFGQLGVYEANLHSMLEKRRWEMEAEEAEKEARPKRNLIKDVARRLNLFISSQLMYSLLEIIDNPDAKLDKRYEIAKVLNSAFNGGGLRYIDIQESIAKKLLIDIFNSRSELYKALNQQSNLIPITLNGSMKSISGNYSKSLQSIHFDVKTDYLFPVVINEFIAQRNPLLKEVQAIYDMNLKRACSVARIGNQYMLKKMIDFGVDLNGTGEWFGDGEMETTLGPMTPVAVAAGHGHDNCVRFLLLGGRTDVNGLSGRKKDYTALDCVHRWMKGKSIKNLNGIVITEDSLAELLKSHGGFSARIHKVYNAVYLGDENLLAQKINQAKKDKINLNAPDKQSKCSFRLCALFLS